MLIQFRKCLKQSISNSKQREDKEQIRFIPLQEQCHLAGGVDACSGLAWLANIWHNRGVIEYPSINMTEILDLEPDVTPHVGSGNGAILYMCLPLYFQPQINLLSTSLVIHSKRTKAIVDETRFTREKSVSDGG